MSYMKQFQLSLVDRLDDICSDALETHYDSQSCDSFTQCQCCGGWEDHEDGCPIPVIQRWMSDPVVRHRFSEAEETD
jgi:hypothetical protein